MSDIKFSDQLMHGSYCPECGAQSYVTDGRPGGKDTCQNGHEYLRSAAIYQPNEAVEVYAIKVARHD